MDLLLIVDRNIPRSDWLLNYRNTSKERHNVIRVVKLETKFETCTGLEAKLSLLEESLAEK